MIILESSGISSVQLPTEVHFTNGITADYIDSYYRIQEGKTYKNVLLFTKLIPYADEILFIPSE